MNYPYTIRSVAQIHPALADHPHINTLPLQGVLVSNAAGSPVNPLAIVDAEKTVEALLAANSECMFPSPCPLTYCLGLVPGVFADPIIETAKNRAHLLR
jgi:hypothetical protein